MKQGLFCILVSLLAACTSRETDTPGNAAAPVSAGDQLKVAIAAHPDSMALRDKLIEWYASQEAYDAAQAAADAALARDSTSAYFWDVKARLYGLTDDTANAIKALEQAVELDPQPPYLLALGYLYADTKNPQALVIGDGLLLAGKAKAKKEALLIKGMYYSKAGSGSKALALFDEALAADYTFMFGYREKAITLYNMGRYPEALKTLQKATILQNNFDEGYYWMGQCYEKMGQKEDAINAYQKALLYAPNNDYAEAADALSRLGVQQALPQ